jgi:uncharacterized protein YlxW (UPF0749 family)
MAGSGPDRQNLDMSESLIASQKARLAVLKARNDDILGSVNKTVNRAGEVISLSAPNNAISEADTSAKRKKLTGSGDVSDQQIETALTEYLARDGRAAGSVLSDQDLEAVLNEYSASGAKAGG